MFNEIQNLVLSLNEVDEDFSKYKNVKNARKILQEMKVKAQELRMKINDDFHSQKNSKKEIKNEIPTVGVDVEE